MVPVLAAGGAYSTLHDLLQPGVQRISNQLVLPSYLRSLRRNDDGLHVAFKIAHRHVCGRVLELEIFRGFDGEFSLVIVGPGRAVDREFPARAGVLFHRRYAGEHRHAAIIGNVRAGSKGESE
jgi:hypothetical protein